MSTTLFSPALSSLFDNLLSLGVNLLVVNVARSLALLPFRGLRLHTDRRSAAAADLLLSIFPRSIAVIDRVSGG